MTLWAIKSRGRISLCSRTKGADGHIWLSAGTSGAWSSELTVHPHLDRPYVGPLWRRKRDAKEMCTPGETVVRVKVVADE